MSKYEKYRSTKIVEAKQLDHSGSSYDSRTGKREPFFAGDYLVREGGAEHIENGELFDRTHERVFDKPPDVTESNIPRET